MLTAKFLREVLHYDPETGVFRWLKRPGKRGIDPTGRTAGSVDGSGYVRISILGKTYLGHRLAWLYMTGSWPDPEADHANTIRSDNAWGNLREATRGRNMQNKRRKVRSPTGVKGVTLVKGPNPFRVCIQSHGVRRLLGQYDDLDMAGLIYHEAALKYNGSFARGA